MLCLAFQCLPRLLRLLLHMAAAHGLLRMWRHMAMYSLLQGVLRRGQDIEVRPGIATKIDGGQFRCRPIRSRITSLFAESNSLEYAVPGGLIGVGTTVGALPLGRFALLQGFRD